MNENNETKTWWQQVLEKNRFPFFKLRILIGTNSSRLRHEINRRWINRKKKLYIYAVGLRVISQLR